jgi:hypothetical protein
MAAFVAVALLFALQYSVPGPRRIEGDLRTRHEYACNVRSGGCGWSGHAALDVDGQQIPLNNEHGLFDQVCSDPKVVPRVRAQSDFRAGDLEAKLLRAEVDCGDGFKPFKRFLRSVPVEVAAVAFND